MKNQKSSGESDGGSTITPQSESTPQSQPRSLSSPSSYPLSITPNEPHENPPLRIASDLKNHCQKDEEAEAANRASFVAEMKVGVAENAAEGGPRVQKEDGDGDEECGEEEDEDEDEEDEEDAEDEKEEVGEEAEEKQGRPNLAEGFYEIEAIRKKRNFKGEPQYLIKWRGWPESSNTWEPLEHLQTCPDVVEAFEERQSWKKKGYRKRKRKFTQQKKKMQYSYGRSKSKLAMIQLPIRDKVQSSDDISNLNFEDGEPSLPSSNGYAAERIEGVEEPLLARKDILEGPRFFHTVGSKDNHQNGDSEHENMNANKFYVQCHQSVSMDCNGSQSSQSKVDSKEPIPSDRCTGAKRRKSGSVRRLKQDTTSVDQNCPQNLRIIDLSSYDRNVHQMVGWKNNFDFNSSVITKIIKPIGYSAAVSNNIHDVSVTFMALRADGKEVMVDNKFLKANNPQLLINFYEEHLRYNPSS